MEFFKMILIDLISSLTRYVGNVSSLTKNRKGCCLTPPFFDLQRMQFIVQKCSMRCSEAV